MTSQQIADALAEPFEASEVKFKPQSVKGNRALAVCFIDARLVMDRLDEVVGVDGWKDEYTPVGDSVVCRLSVRIGGEWVTKTDVGGESEQPDSGDRTKAAFSDALKRAAVKFGIGRYIYRLGHQWADYDPAKRAFTNPPRLPAWALPKKQPARPAPAPYAGPDHPPEPQPAKLGAVAEDLIAAIRDCDTIEDLEQVGERIGEQKGALSDHDMTELRAAYQRRKKALPGVQHA